MHCATLPSLIWSSGAKRLQNTWKCKTTLDNLREPLSSFKPSSMFLAALSTLLCSALRGLLAPHLQLRYSWNKSVSSLCSTTWSRFYKEQLMSDSHQQADLITLQATVKQLSSDFFIAPASWHWPHPTNGAARHHVHPKFVAACWWARRSQWHSDTKSFLKMFDSFKPMFFHVYLCHLFAPCKLRNHGAQGDKQQ